MAGSSYSVVGPPHGCNHAARTSTHNRRGRTGHFYIKDRTALTPYGLARHGSIAVLAAESAFLDNIVAGRYSDGKADLHLVCAAYSGESHTIDRKGHDPEQIDRPLVAIALTVQPHVLEALISHPIARAQGLVARFGYAMPETRLGRRQINAPVVPGEVLDGWAAVVRRVAKSADKSDRISPATGSVGSVGTSEPVRITLSVRREC